LAFFDLPIATKLAVARPASAVSRGYNCLADQNHAATFATEPGVRRVPPDLQESFAIGPVIAPLLPASIPSSMAAIAYAPNLWPLEPQGLYNAFIAYYAAMERLSARLMSLFAFTLDLPLDFFSPSFDRHASILRAVHYPAPACPPLPGQLRAGPHTDFGILTILRIDDAPGGLQVRDHDGGWCDVIAPPDSFVVNIGDLMRHWTNGRWRSSVHRVVNPPTENAGYSRRLSLVFFHEPNPDALIRRLPSCIGEHGEAFPDVIAATYRQNKVAELRGIPPTTNIPSEGPHGF
jgi:isopenicillin N synthase-like dioxygenase